MNRERKKYAERDRQRERGNGERERRKKGENRETKRVKKGDNIETESKDNKSLLSLLGRKNRQRERPDIISECHRNQSRKKLFLDTENRTPG